MKEQLIELLARQKELDAMQDDFIGRVKEIQACGCKMPTIFEVDGEIYELRKQSDFATALYLGRKHKGFYHDYRIVRIGKPVS